MLHPRSSFTCSSELVLKSWFFIISIFLGRHQIIFELWKHGASVKSNQSQISVDNEMINLKFNIVYYCIIVRRFDNLQILSLNLNEISIFHVELALKNFQLHLHRCCSHNFVHFCGDDMKHKIQKWFLIYVHTVETKGGERVEKS